MPHHARNADPPISWESIVTNHIDSPAVHRTTHPPVAGIALILLLALAACGDGTEEAADGSAARTGSDGAAAATSATLIVAGETYEFDRPRCAFGPEETGREDTEFVLSAIQDGMQLDATINTRFGHVVSLDDIEDHENPRVSWSAGEVGSTSSGSEEIIRLDGKRVTVEATFTDQTTGTTADGALEATCP